MSGFIIGLVVIVHVVCCVALMASILLQSGKGGGLAGAFGAGSSQTLFGGRGAATFLSRATTILAVVFFLTSLTLGLNASRTGARTSLIQEEARRRGQRGELPPATAPSNPQGNPAGASVGGTAPQTSAPAPSVGPAAPTATKPALPTTRKKATPSTSGTAAPSTAPSNPTPSPTETPAQEPATPAPSTETPAPSGGQ